MAAQDVIVDYRAEEWPKAPRTGRTSPRSASLVPQPVMQDMTLPDEILFGAMPDLRLRFRRPLLVQIERTAQGATAKADEIGEFGHGASSGQALYDLGKTIAELYFSLNAEKDRLSADLEALRVKLDEYIEERQQAALSAGQQ